MSKPFLRFEDGKVSLGGKDLMVNSAKLSMDPQLNIERVYGDFDADIVGAKTEFVNFCPNGDLKGQLDVTFFISADTFTEGGTPNTVGRMFEIKDGMSEQPVNRNIVGRYAFDNMFLKSFEFSISPFSVIEATASYDIFGTIRKVPSSRFTKLNVDFAHSMKSFGYMEASGSSSDSAVNSQFEITSLKYKILVDRKVHSSIRASENTSIGTRSDGVLPSRVSIANMESQMDIECNEIIPNLNSYGNQQLGSSSQGLQKSEIQAFLYDLSGNKIARFSTFGRVVQQSYSASEGQQSVASISVREVIK
tara:strand:+ start:3915 stop:4832 length:918 start_codon:yes stop_codon:yes gene_type:complete